MILCVDCDNVLNNLQEAVTNVFFDTYSKSYTLDNFTKYNVSECINKEDVTKMKALYNSPEIYNYVNPLPGAQNVIRKLIRAGHEVYIVTHSDPNIFAKKVEWIKFHFSAIDESHIISMEHKWLFKSDIMVEDNLDNLLGGHHYERVCFDYPWNRDVRDDVYSIHRVFDWDDAFNTINKINQNWSDVI